jgi:uncharacterized protein
VGDIVRVWVIEVDKERRRVSLTMVEPGTEAPPQQRRPQKSEVPKPHRPERPARPRRPVPASAGANQAGGNQTGGNQSGGKKPYTQQAPRPKPKPRPPLRPLTKEMKEGKEPLRTFGDLLQFMQMQKPDEPSEAASS